MIFMVSSSVLKLNKTGCIFIYKILVAFFFKVYFCDFELQAGLETHKFPGSLGLRGFKNFLMTQKGHYLIKKNLLERNIQIF